MPEKAVRGHIDGDLRITEILAPYLLFPDD
jgi:hypothetical protein